MDDKIANVSFCCSNVTEAQQLQHQAASSSSATTIGTVHQNAASGYEKEGQTGSLDTISFCGYTAGSRTRISVAEAGTGTIFSFTGENQHRNHIFMAAAGTPLPPPPAAPSASGDPVPGSRNLLDSSKKDEVKAAASGICPLFRSSRFKLNKPRLLGVPRRVLRSDDSTGSDESIEVAENLHQSEAKEKGTSVTPSGAATPKLQLLTGIAGLKEELLNLRNKISEAADDGRSSGGNAAEDGAATKELKSEPQISSERPSPAEEICSQRPGEAMPAEKLVLQSFTSTELQQPRIPADESVLKLSRLELQPSTLPADEAVSKLLPEESPAAEEVTLKRHERFAAERPSENSKCEAPKPRQQTPLKNDSHENLLLRSSNNSNSDGQHKCENPVRPPKSPEVPRPPPESLPGEMDASRKARENANFVWVNNKRYQKLGKIGSGGSSHVFKVIAQDCTIYALKRIILKGRDHQTACGFHQEIEYLERLRGKRHIIQLIDYEVTDKNIFRSDYASQGDIQNDVRIYMVLEYGEIDLARMLERKKNEDGELDENWLRLYWEHILKAVNTIHEERIVHADLKPANFLLVQGALKLIDFGIAKAIQNDTTNIVRESQVGTLNYMSPEAFMMNSRDENGTVKCGRSSDIWSLGCILYQMIFGRTPFSHLNFYQKITEITNPKHVIDFPPVSNTLIVDVMKRCLVWDQSKRPRIPQLLDHPFLRPRPPEEQQQQCLREALLQSLKAYVTARGSACLAELIRKIVKAESSSSSSSFSEEEIIDSVFLPFAKLYMQKAGKPALHELLTSVVL